MDTMKVGVDSDEKYMSRALSLAQKGVYSTAPNPMVGCVIVKNAEIVGEGWHQYTGGAHAEVIALRQAAEKAKDATMYVTLEPCNHHGKTPPCTRDIIKQGIARVVIATPDPNLTDEGSGIDALRQAGIDITVNVCQQSALEMNRAFFKRVTTKLPWVTLKTASSLDGKTAMSNGESQWITGDLARQDVQKLRASHDAVMTGIGTVLRDNPKMNMRLPEVSRQPVRVILDSNMSTPVDAKILTEEGNVIIFTSLLQDEVYDGETTPWDMNRNNLEIIPCRKNENGIDLHQVLTELAQREINSVLIEAGAHLSGNILQQKLVDEIVLYMSPDVLGSHTRELFKIDEIMCLQDKINLRYKEVVRVGDDLRITLGMVD